MHTRTNNSVKSPFTRKFEKRLYLVVSTRWLRIWLRHFLRARWQRNQRCYREMKSRRPAVFGYFTECTELSHTTARQTV